MQQENRWYYTPLEAAKMLNWNAHYIRVMARTNPKGLPFPTLVHLSRTQIPKEPFEEFFKMLSSSGGKSTA